MKIGIPKETKTLAVIAANVVGFDKSPDRLAPMVSTGSNVTTLYPYQELVASEVSDAGLAIAKGINVQGGPIVHPALIDLLG